MSIISLWTRQTASFLFPFLLVSSLLIKATYLVTCDCQAVGQPFNAWFFPAFHHFPWTFYWTFHGITWLAGPYSLIWWIINSPAYFGYNVFFAYLLIMDFLVSIFLRYRVGVAWASIWAVFSVWFVALDPVDFFPVALTFLGCREWKLLLLAPLTKLPLGSEPFVGLKAWSFVLNDPNSLHGPENYSRYLILIAFWILSLCGFLWARKRRRLSVNWDSLPSSELLSHYSS